MKTITIEVPDEMTSLGGGTDEELAGGDASCNSHPLVPTGSDLTRKSGGDCGDEPRCVLERAP